MEPLVSVSWLAEHIDQENLILLDASLYAKADGSGANSSTQTLPGARFFDLKNRFSDLNAPFPNTFPSPGHFQAEAQKLGINQNAQIVVFDRQGIYSAPRVWWMFRTMGHHNVAVLDGGLTAWIAAGLPTIEAPVTAPNPGNFQSAPLPDRILSYEQMVANSEQPDFLVVDARSRGRFLGSDPEPRARLKSGHIPNSVCIPYQSLISDGFLKKPQELRPIFEEATGGRTDLVFSCGSGLTACIVLLASEVAYTSSPRVYDGSWTEWTELQGLLN